MICQVIAGRSGKRGLSSIMARLIAYSEGRVQSSTPKKPSPGFLDLRNLVGDAKQPFLGFTRHYELRCESFLRLTRHHLMEILEAIFRPPSHKMPLPLPNHHAVLAPGRRKGVSACDKGSPILSYVL